MMEEKGKNNNKKVLFYIANPYVFRSGAIGYLYELAQVFSVVFVSEELDPETARVVRDKQLFPKLEKIVPIQQFTPFSGKKMNLLEKNYYLKNLASDVLNENNPDIVVASSDAHSLFELYLMRFAKKKGIIKVTLQTGNVEKNNVIVQRVDLTNAYLRFPRFLPLWKRLLLVKLRKYVGHFLYYFLLPLLVGSLPFKGKSSFILYRGMSGMRDSDHQTVFSEKDRRIYIEEGVPEEKLHIILHPLKTATKEWFRSHLWSGLKKENSKKTILVLLPEDRIGFTRDTLSLVSENEMRKRRFEAVRLIALFLKKWQILLKPHPDIKNLDDFLPGFAGLSDNLKIIEKNDPLDKYIEIADAIIELPLAAGTALYTAVLQCPEKPIISLDFNKEILGDYYRDFPGIEYINSEDRYIEILNEINNGSYRKNIEEKEESKNFPNIVELLRIILNKEKKE